MMAAHKAAKEEASVKKASKGCMICGFLALLGLFLAGCTSTAPEVEVAPEVGARAPDFTLPRLDGTLIKLSDLRGRTVLLNFWAIRCPPCQYEMPFIQAAFEELAEEDYAILAVDIGESSSTVSEFIEARGYTFPVAMDPFGDTARKYGIPGIPTSFLIGKQGLISYIRPGPFRSKGEIVERLESIE